MTKTKDYLISAFVNRCIDNASWPKNEKKEKFEGLIQKLGLVKAWYWCQSWIKIGQNGLDKIHEI